MKGGSPSLNCENAIVPSSKTPNRTTSFIFIHIIQQNFGNCIFWIFEPPASVGFRYTNPFFQICLGFWNYLTCKLRHRWNLIGTSWQTRRGIYHFIFCQLTFNLKTDAYISTGWITNMPGNDISRLLQYPTGFITQYKYNNRRYNFSLSFNFKNCYL